MTALAALAGLLLLAAYGVAVTALILRWLFPS